MRSSTALWAAILVPPLAWAADETVSYAVVKWACGQQAGGVLHLFTVATLAMIAVAAVAGWRADRENDRAQFMAILGLLMSAFFVVVVIATAVPKWVLNVCQ